MRPKGISHVELRNVSYRSMNLDLTIRGIGTTVKQCLINGREVKDGLLGAGGAGRKKVVITLSNTSAQILGAEVMVDD